MRDNPSESDLLQCANKTMYLPLFLKVISQFLDCGEFIKPSFTCSSSLQAVPWPFPVDAVKRKKNIHEKNIYLLSKEKK